MNHWLFARIGRRVSAPWRLLLERSVLCRAVCKWVGEHKFETVLIASLLVISITAHAWNMFHFPYYENDEATYASRAWTFITEGRLDVYTYRYDHAPLGWMLLGVWQLLTGGAHVFGSLLASGRIFMLVLHIASTVLVYILAKRFSGGSKVAAAVAVLFFALSPIALYFQRRILLDNIMAFWLLLTLYFATQPVKRLKYFVASGLVFGIAVLTKLNAVFFGPALLYLVWVQAHKKQRLHAGAYWTTIAGMVVVSFFLFALLKGELFSAPIGPDGNPAHVSVMDTFALQLGRGDFAWPWEYDSSFQSNLRSWLIKDWAVLPIGAAATLGLLAVGIRRRRSQPQLLVLAALVLSYVAFLARGKIVLDLYIVPLLPLLALAIGVFVSIIYKDWLRWPLLRPIFLAALGIALVTLFASLPVKHFRNDEVSNQLRGIAWIRANVPKDAVIAADNYAYPYLAEESGYENVSYFFSTEYDPEIRRLYDNDWRNVEYLVLTHEIVEQIKTGTIPRMKQVLEHAILVADYRGDASSYIDLPNYISTNGDWVQVYKIKSRNDIVLQDSWRHFKQTFIVDYGQVIDPSNASLTTSGGQAEAMLRAVGQKDKNMFAGVWQWSKDHLRYRADDKLLSWKWERQKNGKYKLGDSNNVCDADQVVAYSLFKADELWPDEGYGKEALAHAKDWWRKCTFVRDGKRYIDSSADGSRDIRLINTSYFRPALYRYFVAKAPGVDWQELIVDGYGSLEVINAKYKTIPNWVVINTDGSFASAEKLVGKGADTFGFDALMLVLNLAEDARGDTGETARAFLSKLRDPVVKLQTQTNAPPTKVARLLINQILTDDAQTSQRLYEDAVHKQYKPDKGYWANSKNLFDQSWMWQWHDMQNRLPDKAKVTLR